MVKRYKSYGRRSSTRRSFRRSYSSRGKRYSTRKVTVAKAAGVSESVWAELDETERISLLNKKREAIQAALERNIILSQLSGRNASSAQVSTFNSLKDDGFAIEIAKLARTDH